MRHLALPAGAVEYDVYQDKAGKEKYCRHRNAYKQTVLVKLENYLTPAPFKMQLF